MSITKPLNNVEERKPEPYQRPTFIRTEEVWYRNRDYAAYMGFLFPDQEEGEKRGDVETFQLEEGKIISTVTPLENLGMLCGGRREFFKEGSQILDIGSGGGTAIREINEMYGSRGVKAIGLDALYKSEMPLGLTPDIAVAGNWEKMPFEDDTFDRILSVESVLAYFKEARPNRILNPFTEADIPTIKEITRVAKEGAIWRSNIRPSLGLDRNELFTRAMAENGWEMFFYDDVMVARLANKNREER